MEGGGGRVSLGDVAQQVLGLPLIVASTLLFLAGMAFCYFFVFKTVFHFI